jgi:predicted MFS family arabinose efflux permease
MSAFATGLLLVPQGIGALFARGQVGKLTDRIGPQPVVLASIVLTAATTLGFTQAGPRTSDVLLGGYLLAFGAVSSAVSIAVLAAAYQGLSTAQVPHASDRRGRKATAGEDLYEQAAEAMADAYGMLPSEWRRQHARAM